jgi:hypothetical protein
MGDATRPIVVYFSRYQDKDSAGKFSRFVESYKLHPAGLEHDLIIIRKGFGEHELEWKSWSSLLNGITYECRSFPDEHYTFGYMRLVIEEHPERYILFLLSSCEILVDNWLSLFMKHAGIKKVLGCGGTYSSLNAVFLDKRRITCSPFSISVLRNNFCRKCCPHGITTTNIKSLINRFKFNIKLRLRRFGVISKHERFCRANFYPFPNPYLHTAKFMIPPHFLDNISHWPEVSSISSKNTEFLFESGKQSLTNQAIRAGYEVLVIGADGVAYPIDKWKESKTFFSYNQENTVIGDHYNRCYEAASNKIKKNMELLSYGADKLDVKIFMQRFKQ